MVLSYYLYKYPYKIVWHTLRLFNKNPEIIAYCAEPQDYIIFQSVQKHLPPIPVIAKSKTRKYLKSKGINAGKMPAFPKGVIMFRNATHKFPENKIIKIGMRHGAYHFKKFTAARNYNNFDVYMMSSRNEVELAKKNGIKIARAIGFPKLDPIFNGMYDEKFLDSYIKNTKIDTSKKTIIFTATWNKSGMSAIAKWINHLPELVDKYNVLVTVHPWTSKKYISRIKGMKDIYYIDDEDVVPYLAISDLLVGDTSSIIGEFCALDRPIITFEVPDAKRTVPEISDLLKEISIRVKSFDQLERAVEQSFSDPQRKSKERQKANRMMFDQLDGRAGERAAQVIREFLPQL